jgi:hypothetical protein
LADFFSNKNKPGDIEKEISQWTNRKKELMKPYHIKVAHQRVNSFFETTEKVC